VTTQPTISAPKRHYDMIILVMIIFFVISFITNILNSIIVDVKNSFELSLTMTGFLPFTFFIAYGVMSIPAGFLTEKFTEKTLLTWSFMVMSIGSLVFALFPSYWVFTMTLFTLGCCMAVLQVIINPMLRSAGGEEHFAFNSVLAQLVFGGASFLSPFLYQYLSNSEKVSNSFFSEWFLKLVPKDLPWVSLYFVFSFISALLFIYVLFNKYPTMVKNPDETTGDKDTYISLIKNKWTWFYFFGIFCYVGTEQGIGNWISQFLFEYHGLDPRKIGATTVSYFWAMLTVGCLLGLLLLKFFDSRKILIGASSVAILSLIISVNGNSNLALIFFPLIGFFVSVMFSIIFSLALNSIKTHHGSLSGILCTGIAGGAVIPFLVGGIGELFSLKMGLMFLILPLFFIFLIGFLAKPLINNKTI